MSMPFAIFVGIAGGLLCGFAIAALQLPTQHFSATFGRGAGIACVVLAIVALGAHEILLPLFGQELGGSVSSLAETCKIVGLSGLWGGVTAGVLAAVAPTPKRQETNHKGARK